MQQEAKAKVHLNAFHCEENFGHFALHGLLAVAFPRPLLAQDDHLCRQSIIFSSHILLTSPCAPIVAWASLYGGGAS